MYKKEAMQAAIEGKKVRLNYWAPLCYVHYTGERMLLLDNLGAPFDFNAYDNKGNQWELYIEKLEPKFKVKQIVFAEKIGYVKILKIYFYNDRYMYIVTNGISAPFTNYCIEEVPEIKLFRISDCSGI